MGGYKTLDTLDGECTHVIQTRQEYEMLLNQRDRAQREKEEAERAATREITRVKQEAAHEADRAAQMAQAQIDDLLQQVERKTAEIADQRALNANLLRISRERANADRGLLSGCRICQAVYQGQSCLCGLHSYRQIAHP